MRFLYLAAAFLLLPASIVHGHEVRPAFLDVSELQPGIWRAQWKVPVQGGISMNLRPYASHCSARLVQPELISFGASIQTWEWICPKAAETLQLGIDGLDATLTDAWVNVQPLGIAAATTILKPGNSIYEFDLTEPRPHGLWGFLTLGIEHLLTGLDHLAFVLLLMMCVSNLKTRIAAVTSFTIAHSLSLALSVFDLIQVPAQPVEAIIAMSVAFLAAEVLRLKPDRPQRLSRNAVSLAFVFGLLHGLGFSSALSELGLSNEVRAVALALFNVGIELGQLAFIAVLMIGSMLLGALITDFRVRLARTAVYFIGIAATVACFDRIHVFTTYQGAELLAQVPS